MLLTACTGFGSEEVRNQVAGHLDSRTYRNNYQDQHISLDVASLVRGQDTEDTLMRKLNHADTDADPDANMPLPLEANEQIAMLPDVACLEAEYRSLAQCLKEKYGSIKNAPDSEDILCKYVQAQRKYRAKKQFYRSQMLSQQRQDFFARKDTELIEAQLNSDDKHCAVQTKRKAPSISIPERTALVKLAGAEDLRSPSAQAQRAAAVQAMANLCSRMELARNSAKSTRIRSVPDPQCSHAMSEPTTADEPLPVRCQKLQCLFCIGDERLVLQDRTKTFNREQALWKHAKKHLDAIDVCGDIPCPHPICRAKRYTVKSKEHLMNHAQKAHGVRLQSR